MACTNSSVDLAKKKKKEQHTSANIPKRRWPLPVFLNGGSLDAVSFISSCAKELLGSPSSFSATATPLGLYVRVHFYSRGISSLLFILTAYFSLTR